eukprot:gene30334-37907_t
MADFVVYVLTRPDKAVPKPVQRMLLPDGYGDDRGLTSYVDSWPGSQIPRPRLNPINMNGYTELDLEPYPARSLMCLQACILQAFVDAGMDGDKAKYAAAKAKLQEEWAKEWDLVAFAKAVDGSNALAPPSPEGLRADGFGRSVQQILDLAVSAVGETFNNRTIAGLYTRYQVAAKIYFQLRNDFDSALDWEQPAPPINETALLRKFAGMSIKEGKHRKTPIYNVASPDKTNFQRCPVLQGCVKAKKLQDFLKNKWIV